MHGLDSTRREHAGIPVNNQQHFFPPMLTGAGAGVEGGENEVNRAIV